MKCVKCDAKDTGVLDSRVSEDGRTIRRRRECQTCGYRFTTYERMEIGSFVVVKKDGTREPYSRVKLEKGIWGACAKRPIERKVIHNMILDLEDTWSRLDEVTSEQVGSDVLASLKAIDEVAYIRFASVYQDFTSIDDFDKELQKLLPSK